MRWKFIAIWNWFFVYNFQNYRRTFSLIQLLKGKRINIYFPNRVLSIWALQYCLPWQMYFCSWAISWKTSVWTSVWFQLRNLSAFLFYTCLVLVFRNLNLLRICPSVTSKLNSSIVIFALCWLLFRDSWIFPEKTISSLLKSPPHAESSWPLTSLLKGTDHNQRPMPAWRWEFERTEFSLEISTTFWIKDEKTFHELSW